MRLAAISRSVSKKRPSQRLATSLSEHLDTYLFIIIRSSHLSGFFGNVMKSLQFRALCKDSSHGCLSSHQACDKTSALIDKSRVNVTLSQVPTRNRLRPPG